MNFVGYALRPLQPASLLVIALIALLGGIALFGIALGPLVAPVGAIALLLLLAWLFRYAFACLEHIAQGRDRLPALSAEMVGPFDQRPLLLALCFAAATMPALFMGGIVGPASSAILMALIPAAFVVLGVGDRVSDLLNPLALVRTVKGLGVWYWGIVALALAYLVAIVGIARSGAGTVPAWIAIEWSALSLACVVGGAVYERRHALGFEPQVSPEREAERADAQRELARDRLYDELFVHVRTREHGKLGDLLAAALAPLQGQELAAEARQLFLRARQWQSDRALAQVVKGLVSRLLADRQPAKALALLTEARRMLPALRASNDQETRALAAHARTLGQSRLAEQLEREIMEG